MSAEVRFPSGPIVEPNSTSGMVTLEWREWFQNPEVISFILASPLGVESGGTGLDTYTVGDILYASATTTLAGLHDVATGNALISGGVATAPSWGKIGLTTHVSGVLPAANGGVPTLTDGQLVVGQTGLAPLAKTVSGDATLSAAGALSLTVVTASGTYTPTLTNVANLDASTAYVCQYLRVGSVVTVSGQVDVDPTAGGASVQLGISLPIASNFAGTNECGGTAAAQAIAGQVAAIRADIANDRAQLQFIAGDVTNQPMRFSFTYLIV